MKTVVTKAQILRAVREEPLWSRAFITPTTIYGYDATATRENCKTCLVGGVFRRRYRRNRIQEVWSLIDGNTSGDYALMAAGLKVALELIPVAPWNALSVAFETICVASSSPNREINQAERRRLYKWVRTHMPATVAIEEPSWFVKPVATR